MCLILPKRRLLLSNDPIKIVPTFTGVYRFPDLILKESVITLVSKTKHVSANWFLYINACSHFTDYLAGKQMLLKTVPIFLLGD